MGGRWGVPGAGGDQGSWGGGAGCSHGSLGREQGGSGRDGGISIAPMAQTCWETEADLCCGELEPCVETTWRKEGSAAEKNTFFFFFELLIF